MSKKKKTTKTDMQKPTAEPASSTPIPDASDIPTPGSEEESDDQTKSQDKKKPKGKGNKKPSSSQEDSKQVNPSFSGPMFSIKNPGKLKYSLKYALFMDEVHRDLDNIVQVPVRVQTLSFMYDFQHIIQRYSQGEVNISAAILDDICRTLVRFGSVLGYYAWQPTQSSLVQPATQYQTAGTRTFLEQSQINPNASQLHIGEMIQAISEPLRAAGLEDGAINRIIQTAIDNVDRYIVRGVFTTSAMKSAMEETIIQADGFEFGNLTFQQILADLQEAQNLYASVCRLQSIDSFGERCLTLVQNHDSIAGIFNLMKMFFELDGPTAPMAVGAIVRNSMESMHLDPTYDAILSANGLAGQVTAVASDLDLEVHRIVLVEYLMHLIRMFSGYQMQATTNADILNNIIQSWSRYTSLSEHRNNPMILSRHQLLTPKWNPYAAHLTEADIESEFESLNRLFRRRFSQEVVKMVVTQDWGVFAGRIRSLIDERALAKSETWDYIVNLSLNAISVFMDAFSRTWSFFNTLAHNRDIYFLDDNSNECDPMLSFFDAALDQYKVSALSATHPSAARDPAFLINTPTVDITIPTPAYSFRDEMRYDRSLAVYDPINDEFHQFFTNEILSGTMLDVADIIPYNVMLHGLTHPMHCTPYLVRTANLAIMDSDLGKSLVEFPSLLDLVRTGHFQTMFAALGKFEVFTDPEEIARHYKLPLSIATTIFNNAPSLGDPSAAANPLRLVYHYTGPVQQILFFPEDELPLYCHAESGDVRVPDLVTRYPFYASASFKGLDMPIAWLADQDHLSRSTVPVPFNHDPHAAQVIEDLARAQEEKAEQMANRSNLTDIAVD